jgi:glycosyltransferase involved in cell wall biosynthesis
MQKIIAVIVSHNRQALLLECIEALRNQTQKPDAILVVNNGSSDYTSVWLDKQSDIIQLYQDNLGSAGGYHAGISWAYKNGYTWIWCMDDDGHPKNDALEILMNNRGFGIELLNCSVINKTDKKTFVSKTKNYKSIDEVKGKVIEGVGHPFNGTMMHRSIIEKVGLPQSNLFYWGEEREYFYRIVNKYKIPAKTITHSIQYHPELSHAHKKEWDYKTSWKMYFYVRNRYKVMQSRYSNKFLATLHYAYFTLAFIKSIFIFQQKDKIRKVFFTFWPVIDSLKNNFSDTPETIQDRMNKQYKMPISSFVFYPFKKAIVSMFVPRYSEGSGTTAVEL